jgi:ABC-type bacteriocin/lantibiotic exporter with double-glycine peptidase domain
MKSKISGRKLLSGSFWLIMAIHLVVFTSIGLLTQRWRLLFIFLGGLALLLCLAYLLRQYFKRHPGKK